MRRSFGWLFGTPFVASTFLHAGIMVLVSWLLRDARGDADAAKVPVSVELVATPTLGPPPAPVPPKAPAPAPKPKRARPRPVAAPRPEAVATAPTAPDAAPSEPEDPSGAEVGAISPDAGVAPDATAVALEPLDLRPSVPGAARFVLVLYAERLRGTPWASALDLLLAPLPDHRIVLGSTTTPIAELFHTLVIASPNLRDPTVTFLAARPATDLPTLKQALAAPALPSDPPRVTWSEQEPWIGERAASARVGPRDTRVFVVPTPEWILLIPREHLPELLRPKQGPPEGISPKNAGDAGAAEEGRWLDTLAAVERELTTQVPSPLAVISAADLGVADIALPGLPPLPAPLRLSVTVYDTDTPAGFAAAGILAFATPEQAQTFARHASTLRAAALASTTTRFFLRRFHVEAALQSLTLEIRAMHILFSTRMDSADAAGVLRDAAAWAQRFFGPPRTALEKAPVLP
jgi:hypothetical protein